MQLLPSHDAVSLITVLPEQLQSPLLTAEWEYRLGEIERGQLAPEEFLDGISTMLKDLVGTYQVIKGTEYLFTPPREVVGKCPRCGGEVAELQKGFFCQNDSCKFAIWKNNKWWAAFAFFDDCSSNRKGLSFSQLRQGFLCALFFRLRILQDRKSVV